MKNIFFASLVMFGSLSVNAQSNKPVSARPSEQKEIIADNHLKKSIQQKQLALPPERISDSTQQSPSKPIKKKRKCGTKVPKKV